MTGKLRSLLITGTTVVALLLGLPAPGASAAPAAVGYDVSHRSATRTCPAARRSASSA